LIFLKKIGAFITKTNEMLAKAASLLVIPMMFLLLAEAFMRHFFWKSLYFAYDMTWMFFAVIVFLGGGHTLASNMHVKVDIFYQRLNRRAKRIVDLISYPAFLFLTTGALVYSTYHMMMRSIEMKEGGLFTPWNPPMWPIRTIIFFSFTMLALQGVVKFIEAVGRKGEEEGS